MMIENLSSKNYNSFGFLWKYLAPFKKEICIILISIFIVSSAILGLGYALKHVIDKGFVEKNLENLNQSFILLLLSIIAIAFASYNRSVRVNTICDKLESNIRSDALSKILKFSPENIDSFKVNDIVSRLTTDLGILSNSLMLITSYSLRNILMGIGALILLIFTSIKLTIYVFLILPFSIVPIVIIGKKTKNLSRLSQQEIAKVNSYIEETSFFLKTIQSYNQEEEEFKRFSQLQQQSQSIANKRIKLRSLLFALVIGLILSSIAIVLLIGGYDIVNGNMTAGNLSSFIFYAILVATSIGSLSEIYSDWQRALGASDRIFEIINAKPLIFSPIKPTSIPNIFDIRFSSVNFSYPSRLEKSILKDLSFFIPQKQVTSIVGPSGSGKTSILNLLLRFYDPNSGEITIGEQNIKNFDLQHLRKLFAYVSQDPVIFSASARYNIAYGNPSATEEEIIKAAKAAEIYEFLMSLENGLDTNLGEKGKELSGGQRQRVAIARAILSDPKILLLDEATNSLDNENEKLVQQALARLKKDRTTIIISHRLSSIKDSDNIIVIDNGKVVDQGKHSYLIKSCTLYQKLIHLEESASFS